VSKEVPRITDKTLSKELKSLEANKLINRKVYNTFPPTVEYSITAHGKSLEKVIEELHYWGLVHRKDYGEVILLANDRLSLCAGFFIRHLFRMPWI
jgi:DNA-binding HxlR family transcriptional regulator